MTKLRNILAQCWKTIIKLQFFQKGYYTSANFPPPQVEYGFDNTAKMTSSWITNYFAKFKVKIEHSVKNWSSEWSFGQEECTSHNPAWNFPPPVRKKVHSNTKNYKRVILKKKKLSPQKVSRDTLKVVLHNLMKFLAENPIEYSLKARYTTVIFFIQFY